MGLFYNVSENEGEGEGGGGGVGGLSERWYVSPSSYCLLLFEKEGGGKKEKGNLGRGFGTFAGDIENF